MAATRLYCLTNVIWFYLLFHQDCDKGTARCLKIQCYIDKLNETVKEAHVVIKSVLWNSTFLEVSVATICVYNCTIN